MKLERYKAYSRKDIHDMLEPTAKFTPRAGTWGLQGIVNITGTKDYVFYVNKDKDPYGDELYTDGNVMWYSQNYMTLSTGKVLDFINHDPQVNNIYMFWRPKNEADYSYLGLLEYVTHDNTTQRPVRFYWHIIDFDDKEALSKVRGLQLKNRKSGNYVSGNNGGTTGNTGNTVVAVPLNGKLTVTPAPARQVAGNPRNGVNSAAFGAGNVDFIGEAKKNTKIGKAGEDMVVRYEKDRLNAAGFPNLAQMVVATRDTIGNAAKYDVKSYETNGTVRYIEVKTTTGSINNSFHISEGEVAFSEAVSNQYYLYRVYEFDKDTGDGKLYILNGSIDRNTLKATNYVSL